MAATPVEFKASPGQTLTAYLIAYGSDTIGNTGGDVAVEATNCKGRYSATVTEALVGLYDFFALDGSGVEACAYSVLMADDTAIHRCFDPAGADGAGVPTAAENAAAVRDVSNASPAAGSLGAAVNNAASSGSGVGATPVNHNTGGADTLRVVDGAAAGIDDVVIRAYVAAEFTANPLTAVVRGQATTEADGRWTAPINLDAGIPYTLTFTRAGFSFPTASVTP